MTLAEKLAAKKAATPEKSSGLVITPEVSRSELRNTIKATLDAGPRPIIAPPPKTLSPTPPPEEVRELGATQTGERLPLQQDQWTYALHSPATSLCIVMEAETPHAWLAIANPNEDPLLLMRLPLHPLPHANDNPF